ncbi:uncharacterized protein BDV14DRAFT_177031 [Aspergillus stella-maris]|uniref:uncharacterized protein n=1 Tax=Aspergillus stella-maris TaxID=1810926 RepID=UPI003CCDD69E
MHTCSSLATCPGLGYSLASLLFPLQPSRCISGWVELASVSFSASETQLRDRWYLRKRTRMLDRIWKRIPEIVGG